MLYYKATAGCGVGVFVGVSVRKSTAPVSLILAGSCTVQRCCRPRCRPPHLLRHPLHAHWKCVPLRSCGSEGRARLDGRMLTYTCYPFHRTRYIHTLVGEPGLGAATISRCYFYANVTAPHTVGRVRKVVRSNLLGEDRCGRLWAVDSTRTLSVIM